MKTLLNFSTVTTLGLALLTGCGNGVAFNGRSLTSGNNSSSSSPIITPGGGTTPPGGCQLQSLNRPVKVLFLVDTSGSNNSPTMNAGTAGCDPTQQTCAPATDPQKHFRSGSITTFFDTFQTKSNFSWGFEVFSGTAAQSYISGFGNATAMQSAINAFNAETDDNGTPYLAALSQAKSAIANDSDLNSTTPYLPLYEIVFMSDGYPTDAITTQNTVNVTALDSAISGILALAPGRVSLNAIYYGTINDPTAAATLENMATVGEGQFVNVDTGSTSSIVIDDIITVPSGQCQ